MLSVIIIVFMGCQAQEEEIPDVLNNSPVEGVRRRIPTTSVPPSLMLYCQNRPRTVNDPSIVLVRNGEETFVKGVLSDLNMQDVEKIEVLKSEAAVARFGEKANYGVIRISVK
ncbi:hypothetical protein [Roseivirga sp. E12]|uniref:hypothetical protein n=1 Tax=Roseivirga sp. E12 TaxID=2819237 RepID=UPI001ABBFB9E|nr:hypothetical protein [Roseivirga sp. E12]MBO3698519.1 hypothetical protein [Roseivirga sp. E12]